MKKSLIVLCVVIIICSLLTISFLLNLPSAPSDGGPQTSAQPTAQSTSTPQTTPQQTYPQPTPIDTSQPIDPAMQQAIQNAVTYLQPTDDAVGLLMLNVIYRQFGVAEFSNSLQRYDQILADNPDPRTRVFRRIADYDNSIVQPDDFSAVTDQLDKITYPALYADRRPLPNDYLLQLQAAMDTGFFYAQQSVTSGAYLLTHALMATIFLHDNHSTLQLPENFTSALYEETAMLIGDGSQVDDIELEAAAFLYQAGQGNLVPTVFVQNVLAAQNSDGGWSVTHGTDNSHWHPSVLALMLILHVAYPEPSYPPMLAWPTS